MRQKRYYIWLFLILMANCVFAKTPFIFPVDIDYNNPEKYLIPGKQSTIDEKYLEEIKREILISKQDIEGVGKIFSWMMKNFSTFAGGGSEIGINTINKLLKRRTASGCHDHGLIFSSILRYFGYPAIMVDAAGIQWAEQGGNFPATYSSRFS